MAALRRAAHWALAARRQIPIHRCRSIDDPELIRFLAAVDHDVLFVYRAPILPPAIYRNSRHAINLHPSFLPAYRGGHPLLWAVWDDARTTGCTVHRLEERADTGAIIAQRELAIPDGVREAELERIAEVDVGVPLAIEAIARLARGEPGIPQPATSPTPYARRRSREAIWREIGFESWTAERVWRVLRFTGLTPFEIDPAPGRDRPPVIEWRVGRLEPRPGAGAPGSLQRDHRGIYVSLPGGRVRLLPRLRPRRAVRWLRRRRL
jgi:methionyl-tRNA formyltransferase